MIVELAASLLGRRVLDRPHEEFLMLASTNTLNIVPFVSVENMMNLVHRHRHRDRC
ncbi:MAG: hypothetical protein ACWGHV_08085 [Stutzerimonas stutzeri]